jgi:hypothetical protein
MTLEKAWIASAALFTVLWLTSTVISVCERNRFAEECERLPCHPGLEARVIADVCICAETPGEANDTQMVE